MSVEESAPHPFVYWAQNRSYILLRVDLKDVKNPDVQVNENCVKCSTLGVGARGNLLYEFELELNANIDPLKSQYRVTPRQIDISLRKEDDEWWPKLTSSNIKPTWLKIDFDRWKTEDDEEEEALTKDNLNPAFEESAEEPTFTLEKLKKLYLFIYNLWQLIGFLYIVLTLTIRYMKDGEESFHGAYESIHNALKFCQLMQILEIFHPVFGYTKGGVTEAIVQVGGRFVVLFCLIEAEPRIQTKPVIFYLVLSWSVIELFRYPYYMARVYNKDIGIITWLRYTMWIPLYPLGFICEGVVILRNIPYFEETEKFSVALPNQWNFSFHYPTLMRIYLLFFFLPAMYSMMAHMQRQRRKKIGPFVTKSSENKDD